MLLLRFLTICILSASAVSVFMYQGIEFAHAMFDVMRNR
jgi:hypothetical protein